MNKYKGFAGLIIIVEVLLIVFCNVLYINDNNNSGRLYRVEAKRIVMEIEEQKLSGKDVESLDLSEYETIVKVSEFVSDEECNNDYLIEKINDKLYRIEYHVDSRINVPVYMNIVLLGMMFITGIVIVYVYKKVLKPFQDMSNLSYELAKGNLSMPIKEEKSKLFGRFLWGMDMLREKLEDNKEKELEFQKERMTLILSLSHDIKTPLSSIELYSKALEENLYDTQEKKNEALHGIIRNVKEIKGYVDEIVTASREDFLNLEVRMDEFYLSEAMKMIENYYRDKLSVIHTIFEVAEIPECLVNGDKNRLVEVLQNIMENAIKYGDGKYVRISFDEEEDCKLIHIENSGCSLKEEELPNLFDSFYRGSNSNGVKGNGLGLYICKTLMRKMDGEIYAQIHADSFSVTVVVRKA